MADDKKQPTPAEEKSGFKQLFRAFLHAADLPADLTVIGLVGYAITHGLFGIGGKSGNVSVKGVSDEAGFKWLCDTLKTLGGIYGDNVSASIRSIHATLFTMDPGVAEIFRGILLSNLKEADLAKFFTDLKDAMPKSIYGRQDRLKAHLAGHSEPRIRLCVELHKEIESIRQHQQISLEEASEILVKKALSNGEIPSTLTLQGKEKFKQGMAYLDSILTPWSQSLERRREEDPSRMYFDETSFLGRTLGAWWLRGFVTVSNGKVGINIVATLIVIATIASLITVFLQKP